MRVRVDTHFVVRSVQIEGNRKNGDIFALFLC